jgi:uncharacterized protein (TIGR03435 family)
MNVQKQMMRIVLAALAAGAAAGQTFDVASVKPAAEGARYSSSGGPGTGDPGRIRYQAVSLKDLIQTAFGVQPFQISGPTWMDSSRFDVSATMPPETTRERFRSMLQNLLVDRFQMACHREPKEMAMYSLVMAKDGPKLKDAGDAPAPDPSATLAGPPAQRKRGPDGFPLVPPSFAGKAVLLTMVIPGKIRAIGQKQDMHSLAEWLTGRINRPVEDHTGLTGKYDFVLTFAMSGVDTMGMPLDMTMPASAEESAADVFHALQEQLGLRLESRRGPVETIVVDRLQRLPTEN